MRERLARNIAELEAERSGLEAKVEARTAELTQTLAELRSTQAALIHGERLASIGQLVAGVAHEIGNPLNAIAGASGPLGELAADLDRAFAAYRDAEAELPEPRRKALRDLVCELDLDASIADLAGIATVVKRGVQRSVRILDNLKSFSRASGEDVPANLNAAIDDTLMLLGSRLRASSIEVEKKLGALPPVVCRVGEINQVFMNLLMNAIQAVEAGGSPARRLTIETAGEPDGFARVVVSDSGAGVPPELAGRIFDPFFTTKARSDGTGLGLSISTDIARRHGGSLALEPQDGSPGARFVLRIPFQPRGRRA
jgi:C4-dicarboxylate-specific signal transduction histidine kinase